MLEDEEIQRLREENERIEADFKKLKEESPHLFDENGKSLPISEEDRVMPRKMAEFLIQELTLKGFKNLNTTKDLNKFLANYPQEKYKEDITPLILKALQEITFE